MAHLLGLAEFGQGRVKQAATRLAGPLALTPTRLSTQSGNGAPVWRSLPGGHVINRKYTRADGESAS